MSSQIDDQTVYSQLNMPVPDNALVEDTTITDDTALDKRVRETLDKDGVGRSALKFSAREYRDSYEECSFAINVLAKVLLPAIFEDNQHPEEHRDSLIASYEYTIKRHPWLVKIRAPTDPERSGSAPAPFWILQFWLDPAPCA